MRASAPSPHRAEQSPFRPGGWRRDGPSGASRTPRAPRQGPHSAESRNHASRLLRKDKQRSVLPALLVQSQIGFHFSVLHSSDHLNLSRFSYTNFILCFGILDSSTYSSDREKSTQAFHKLKLTPVPGASPPFSSHGLAATP